MAGGRTRGASRAARSPLEEEAMRTALGAALRRFLSNKAAVVGLGLFVAIFLLVFVLAAVFPMDPSYQDTTQQNVAPGVDMADLPSAMEKNPRALSAGAVCSVGADRDGQLHVWGKLTQRQQQIPEGATDIVQVSAGLDHFLALDSQGKVYTWGSNRFALDKIPFDVAAAQPIRQVVAGHQFSIAVSQAGELFFWGNSNLLELDTASIPQEIQTHVVSAAVNSSNVVALLDDGSVRVLGRSATPVVFAPEGASFTQIAVGDQAAAGLTADGRVTVWGNDFYGLLDVPDAIQGRTTAIAAGRFHFVALLDDGSMTAWGRNQLGQTDIPRDLASGKTAAAQVDAGYFLNYAVDTTGSVHAFGLTGYLLGTDGLGRDVFVRLVSGGRLTLTVGAVAVALSVCIGVLLGGLAGFYGGKTDLLLMRLAEIVDAIPFLPLAMTLSVLLSSRVAETQRIFLIMAILGVLSWPGMARLVRGQILSEREKEYVLAAKASGIREWAIIFRHILPNILTPILISATLSYASSLLVESALSFLGFGVAEPNATWGNMLTDAQSTQVIVDGWWRWVFPAAAICLTTISINLVGDGLRDAVDPHSTKR